MTKFKKNTYLSLSLLVDLSMHFDFPRNNVHVPVSLSFSLHLHLQKPEWNSGKNVSSIRKKCSCAIESMQSVVQKPMRTIKWGLSVYIVRSHARIQRGKFLSITGPDPLKFSKLPSQHSTLGHHRHAS